MLLQSGQSLFSHGYEQVGIVLGHRPEQLAIDGSAPAEALWEIVVPLFVFEVGQLNRFPFAFIEKLLVVALFVQSIGRWVMVIVGLRRAMSQPEHPFIQVNRAQYGGGPGEQAFAANGCRNEYSIGFQNAQQALAERAGIFDMFDDEIADGYVHAGVGYIGHFESRSPDLLDAWRYLDMLVGFYTPERLDFAGDVEDGLLVPG